MTTQARPDSITQQNASKAQRARQTRRTRALLPESPQQPINPRHAAADPDYTGTQNGPQADIRDQEETAVLTTLRPEEEQQEPAAGNDAGVDTGAGIRIGLGLGVGIGAGIGAGIGVVTEVKADTGMGTGSCQKCGGYTCYDHDSYGEFISCLNCGRQTIISITDNGKSYRHEAGMESYTRTSQMAIATQKQSGQKQAPARARK